MWEQNPHQRKLLYPQAIICPQANIVPQKTATGLTPQGCICEKHLFFFFLVFTSVFLAKCIANKAFVPPKQKSCPKESNRTDATGMHLRSRSFFWSSSLNIFLCPPPAPLQNFLCLPSTLFLRLACLKITRSHLFQPFISDWVETFSFLFEDNPISKAVCQMISYRVDLTFYNLFCNSHQIFVKNIRFPPKSKLPQISI